MRVVVLDMRFLEAEKIYKYYATSLYAEIQILRFIKFEKLRFPYSRPTLTQVRNDILNVV